MKLIVGVSGGIDSVVLLDKLVKEAEHEIIVAHVDHGMRTDSRQDAEFVRKLAESHSLDYVETSLYLGPGASEEVARNGRYVWLRKVLHERGADCIATAHHQDDVIETMVINLIRGTGWRGLAVMGGDDLFRPMLNMSKAEIIAYALDHGLEWHDDSTNDNVKYLRNYVRYRYVQRMTLHERQQWVSLYRSQIKLRDDVETELDLLLPTFKTDVGYSRHKLIMGGSQTFTQLIQRIVSAPLERSTIDQLWHFVCTARPGKSFVQGGVVFRATTRDLIVSTSDIC